MSPRIGRPKLENPIDQRFSVSIDAATLKRLDEYCDERNLTRSEVVRRGLDLLWAKEKKGKTTGTSR